MGRLWKLVRAVGVTRTFLGSYLVLATDPGNPPAVRVRTGRMGWFGSRPDERPNALPPGRPNLDRYPSTRGLCHVWLDLSVRISGSVFRVLLFMVAFRYPTVICKILTMVRHSHFLMY